jgi:pimeloyl-ACP methyl ester carboxylesterase
MTDFFEHEGFRLSYMDEGEGDPILLVHGFASNFQTNWIGPGWVKTLREAGYRTIAFDHRGHGNSSGSRDSADYTPDRMASDAAALLDHLGVARAHWFGYSMGARVSAFAALATPDKVATLILGGLGIGMVEGVGEWDIVASALLAEDAASITHARGKMFRSFADKTRSDRVALAACIEGSRELLPAARVAQIRQPTLIAVGTKDDIAGSPEELASLMPNAVVLDIPGRDHMLSVGDRVFKARALEFLAANPL